MVDQPVYQRPYHLAPITALIILLEMLGSTAAATAQAIEPPAADSVPAVKLIADQAIAHSNQGTVQPTILDAWPRSSPQSSFTSVTPQPETQIHPERGLLLEPPAQLETQLQSELQSELEPATQIDGLIAQQNTDLNTEEQLLQRLQDLEERQQQLEQEIQLLRQQLENATPPESIDVTAVEPPPEDPQTFSFSTEVLILEPSTSSLQDFAIIGDDIDEAFVVSGDVVGVDYDSSLGLRFTAQYGLSDSPVDLSVRYSTFAADGFSSAERNPDGILLATLSNPSQNESAITADASTGLNYSVTDVELGYTLGGDRTWVRVFGGISFADIQQDLRVQYDGDDFDRAEVRIERDFSGYGLRLGGQANLYLGGNFSLFGRAAAALMMGNFDGSQRETNENGEALIVEFERTLDDRVIPVLELAAGLQWQAMISDSTRLMLAAGYEFQNWFNVVDSARLTDNAGQGVLSQDTDDLGISGFFIRAGIEFEF